VNITFFIGNGFDINIGLKTKYSDFLDYYLDSKKLENFKDKNLSDEKILKKEHIESFKKYVKDNKDFWWSKGELALGKYTSELSEGEGKRFLNCQRDFANELSKYLQSQEKNIDYKLNKEIIIKSFNNLSNIRELFPYKIKQQLSEVYNKFIDENYFYNFVSFNYTSTIKNCIELLETKTINTRSFQFSTRSEYIDNIYNIHGDFNNMILGVNDESQITNIKVFNCENGKEYIDGLIKENTIQGTYSNIEEEVGNLIKGSKIIFIYGMSIGETDKRWWERIIRWLKDDEMNQLIIYKRKKYEESVLPADNKIFEKESKNSILKYSEFSKEDNENLKNRIIIISENIFKNIENIAKFY